MLVVVAAVVAGCRRCDAWLQMKLVLCSVLRRDTVGDTVVLLSVILQTLSETRNEHNEQRGDWHLLRGLERECRRVHVVSNPCSLHVHGDDHGFFASLEPPIEPSKPRNCPMPPQCLLFFTSDGRRTPGCGANNCSDSAHLGPDATSWRQMPTTRLMQASIRTWVRRPPNPDKLLPIYLLALELPVRFSELYV